MFAHFSCILEFNSIWNSFSVVRSTLSLIEVLVIFSLAWTSECFLTSALGISSAFLQDQD